MSRQLHKQSPTKETALKLVYNIVIVCDIVSGEVSVSRAVNKYVIKTIDEHQIQSASFLRSLVLLRDNYLVFSD